MQDQRAAGRRGEIEIVRRRNARALAAVALDQPALLQQPDAFPHGRAVDAELLRKLHLGRQGVADPQPALQDLAFDRLVDQAIGRSPLDPAEFRVLHADAPRCVRSCHDSVLLLTVPWKMLP